MEYYNKEIKVNRVDYIMNLVTDIVTYTFAGVAHLGIPKAGELRAAVVDLDKQLRAEGSSRGMFIARLENEKNNGVRLIEIDSVLALLNDCDYLASLEE
jgi:hypothetical protein